ncbi:MAG TPA: hypothetical protein VHE83_17610 [Mycobacteriales bacterium]|nr:hypothetical protein [Mycobacteriales bacterium]
MSRPHRRRLHGIERAGAWLLAPVVVALVPVTGFEAYALHSRLTPTSYARGGAFGTGTPGATTPAALAPTSTASPRTKPTAPPTTTGPARSSAQRPTASSVSAPAPRSTPVSTAPLTSSPQPRTSAPTTSARSAPRPSRAAVPRPRTGTYTLSVQGTEAAKFGPIGVCNQTLPTAATLTISPATDDSATSYDFDLRFYPGQPDKHDERHIYRYSASQVLLDYEQATVTCGGVKQSTTLPYTPPQVRAQLPLTVGATWHSRGGSSDRTEDATSTVTGTDSISVDGIAYPVFVIRTDVTMSGPESGSRTQAWWYSPALAMPLRIYEKISAHKSGGTYNNEYTATVTSLPR